MVRSIVMMAVLAVHLAIISGSLSGNLVGVSRMGVEPSTSIGVVILAGTEPKALRVVPVLRRVAIHLPPPEALPGSQDSTDLEGVSSASATHREPSAPPFEQLIVEAIPHDAQGLRDFCTSSYPPAARPLNEQGTVVLLVRIEADGHVSDMKVEQSSGSTRLDRVTQACVISAQFAPHRVHLRAVGSWQRIHWTWMPPS
jgi:TonB family protein